jgi:hypothetical protein
MGEGMLQKKILTILTLLAVSSSFAQEPTVKAKPKQGEAAGYSSRDATALSIMGWGTGLAIGIATLAALLNTDANNGHSH